ncbi:MAG TPA: CPBP family intramembrane glutamic endopeptidase [Candidatus Baltobacteraceae bacterium]|nr:CPBP family intramembrane glutamic endopeptidase [Candidatus Baltobacteraceae bacterium]
MRQLNVWVMLGIWAGLSLGAALYAAWEGYQGRAFAATVATFSILLLVMLTFAAQGVAEGLAGKFGPAGGFLLGALVFVTFVIYLVGTGTFAAERAVVMAAFVFVPLGLAVSSRGAAAGSWQDFLTVAGVWGFVKFGPTHWMWPYPGGRLAYVFTVLMAVDVALACFLLVRRAKGVGYSMGWGKNWGLYVIGSFALFGCVAIPLGIRMRFVAFDPHWGNWSGVLIGSLGILFLTACPEELLFRGLLQNFLGRASKSEFAGWWTASMLFGLSHITNLGFPNWRYVILAAIAGLFYGWTWRRTGSIFASALVHAGVDVTWHFLFRTM